MARKGIEKSAAGARQYNLCMAAKLAAGEGIRAMSQESP
jgi:hypothetical protein